MSDFVELQVISKLLLRRWWLIVIAMVVFAGLGFVVSKLQSPLYQATATVLVGRSIQSSNIDRADLQTSQQLALTYADIVRRQPVLQGTIDTLGLTSSWKQLRSRVQVEIAGETQLLGISVEALSPTEASDTANELVHQLTLLVTNQNDTAAKAFAQQRLSGLQIKIEAAQTRLEELNATLLVTTATDEVSVIQTEIETLDGLITQWEDTYAKLLAYVGGGKSVNDIVLVEHAQPNSSPIRPRLQLNLLIATGIGLVLAVTFIFLANFFDNTIKSPGEVTELLGLKLLGTVNQIKGKKRQDMLVIQNSFSRASEDYRLLRSKLSFVGTNTLGKVIMVTSAANGEGKSTTIANLGTVMAEAGLKTVIVDADLRQPTQHQFFQLSAGNGITMLLHKPELKPEPYLASTLVPNLHVLVGGEQPSHPSELLGSPRMKQLLDELAKTANVILCDAPQALTFADASALARWADGVLFVIDTGHTQRDLAVQAVENLRLAGANMIGGILNRFQA